MKSLPFLRKNIFIVLLITAVAFLALGKTLHFYYWWDDFSFFYNAKNSVCPFYWPFNTYCPIWAGLYKLLGYAHPSYWFALAIFLKIIFAFLFFILTSRLFNKKIATFLSIFVVSIGGEGSMMTFYTISESFGLIFLTLILLSLSKVTKKSLKYLVLGLTLFYLSLTLFPIYSTAHVFLVFAFMLIYLKDILKKLTFVIISIAFLLITINVYVGEPFRQNGNLLTAWDKAGGKQLSLQFVKGKVEHYFSTTSAFLLTDYMEEKLPVNFRRVYAEKIRIWIGVFLNLAFLFFLFKNRKNGRLLKLGVFSYLWLITQYLPRGMVTSYGLSSNDRHLYFPFIGFVMILGVLALKKPKFTFPIMLLLLISNLFHTNYYFSPYVVINKNKAIFFKELRAYMGSNIPRVTTVYVDAPRGKISYDLGIFIRAGMHPNEASIATELGVKIEDIKLYTSSLILSQKIKQGEVDADKFFTFYWDDRNLHNNTAKAREMLRGMSLMQGINSHQKATITYNKELGSWTGVNPGINFEIDNFEPLLPSEYYLSIKANLPTFSLPYSQGCTSCSLRNGQLTHSLNYLSYSRLLKNSVSVEVSNTGEDSVGGYLIDNDLNTYWMANRSLWFEGKKPVISLTFPQETNLDGIIIYAIFTKYTVPTEVKLKADGRLVEGVVFENDSGRIKLLAKMGRVKLLEIELLKTLSDMPMVADIDLIPPGFSDINLDLVQKVADFPAARVTTLEDKYILSHYLESGVKACLKWSGSEYGDSQIDFTLYIDNVWHTYELTFPIWGIDNPKLTLDCLNYPADIIISSARVTFPLTRY